MKDIKNKLDMLREDISKVEEDKYKNIFSGIYSLLDLYSIKLEEIMENQAVLAENFRYMDEDISGIQEELFEEVSLEDLEEFEEEYKEILCKNCGKPIFIEESTLKENKNIKCPYCNEDIK